MSRARDRRRPGKSRKRRTRRARHPRTRPAKPQNRLHQASSSSHPSPNAASSMSTVGRSRSPRTSSTTSTRTGKPLRVIQLTDYAPRQDPDPLPVRSTTCEVHGQASTTRAELLAALAERGIDVESLADAAKLPDADPLDLLCHLAFGAAPTQPARARRESPSRGPELLQAVRAGGQSRSSTSFSRNTPNTASRSSAFPMYSRFRRSPVTATPLEIATRFGGPREASRSRRPPTKPAICCS